MYNGFGTLSFANGTVLKGNFIQGLIDGSGIFHHPQADPINVEFFRGSLCSSVVHLNTSSFIKLLIDQIDFVDLHFAIGVMANYLKK